jgi:hypothetical protein
MLRYFQATHHPAFPPGGQPPAFTERTARPLAATRFR